MSSATSTDTVQDVRLKPDPPPTRVQPDQSLQPWQFFVLAALACATGLMRQLDAGAGYRDRIETDLVKRLGGTKDSAAQATVRTCPKCSTANDSDAKFCKSCGAQL